MARFIKETPVLTGEDAYRFEMAAQYVKPASREKKEQVQKAFEEFRRMADFPV